MKHGRKRSVLYALAGAALSALAPAGLLVLREVASPRPVVQELFADSLTYAYVFLVTAIVLSTLGFVLGRQTDRLLTLSATDPLTGCSIDARFDDGSPKSCIGRFDTDPRCLSCWSTWMA
jgi:hypothetical protein